MYCWIKSNTMTFSSIASRAYSLNKGNASWYIHILLLCAQEHCSASEQNANILTNNYLHAKYNLLFAHDILLAISILYHILDKIGVGNFIHSFIPIDCSSGSTSSFRNRWKLAMSSSPFVTIDITLLPFHWFVSAHVSSLTSYKRQLLRSF